MVENLVNLANEFISLLQTLAIPGTVIALIVGGFKHMFGGRDGFENAKPWYIGSSVGLVIALGAESITSFLQSKITF